MNDGIGKDVMDFYYSVPPEKRRYMQWVLSTNTVKQIAESVEVDVDDSDIPKPWSLMGRPIQIDDNIQGLSYKVLP